MQVADECQEPESGPHATGLRPSPPVGRAVVRSALAELSFILEFDQTIPVQAQAACAARAQTYSDV